MGVTRSEFIKNLTALYVRAGWDHGQAERQAIFDANRHQREGLVTWDSEEPEILWTGWPHRYTSAGWQVFVAGEWVTLAIPSPVFDELARRILAEREGSSRDSSPFNAMRESRDFYRRKVEQREQQIEAEKQVSEILRAEIRAEKFETERWRNQVTAAENALAQRAENAKRVEEDLREKIENLRCQVKAQSQVIAEDGAPTAREEKWKEEALHAYKELNERNRRLSRIRAALDDTATNDEDRKLSNVRTALEA